MSFDSLKNSLDDLLQSADTVFSDIGDSFEDHMRNAALNFVKNKYLISALEDWYSQFAEAYSDDVLSKDEVDKLREMYEEAYNKAQDMYDSALEAAGISKESNEDTRSSTTKGIATASQDSIDYLSGLWALSVEYSRSTNESVISLQGIAKAVAESLSKLKENSSSILKHVQNIDNKVLNVQYFVFYFCYI